MSHEKLSATVTPEKREFERCKSLILTSEEYRNTPFAQSEEYGSSYVFELHNGEKKIVFFGSTHSNDPDDPLFDEIQKKFTEAQPDMVFVEGKSRLNERKEEFKNATLHLSPEKMKTDGESSFTLQLAVSEGIDFESPEPQFSLEIQSVLDKGFSKKDTFLYYFYRVVDQYQRFHSERSVEECTKYLSGFLRMFREASLWDIDELHILEEEALQDLDVDDEEKYNAQVDPIPWEGQPQTVISEVSRTSSHIRDQFIFERLIEGLKDHKSLFVVYGSAHAVKLEPALRAYFAQDPS